MKNKVIVITGVSSGIGKAFVLKALDNLSKSDFIIGLGRTDIQNFRHNRYSFIQTDLAKADSIKQAVNQIKKNHKHIDVLINNAGFGYRGAIEDLSLNEIKEQFEVNLFGPVYLTQLILPLMRKQNSGHIVNVGSVGSIISTPTLGYYAMTKASLDKFSEIFEQEVDKFNIKVSTLTPGAVKTDFGKNIRQSSDYQKSLYSSLYQEWQKRFRYFFKNRNSSDDAAKALCDMIQNPVRNKYLNNRDKIMCTLKRVLPYSLFQFLFLNYYFKDESS